MEEIYGYIRNIGYFMIFSAVIRLITPKGSFKAYINLFLGLMFITVMLNPLSKFIKTDLPELRDYFLKNGAATAENIFGADNSESRIIAEEEYVKSLEKRISEISEAYIEEASVSVRVDDSFNVTEVYISGKTVKDASELKKLISGLCGAEEEKVYISGEWEE